jgi:hypothetical protein
MALNKDNSAARLLDQAPQAFQATYGGVISLSVGRFRLRCFADVYHGDDVVLLSVDSPVIFQSMKE